MHRLHLTRLSLFVLALLAAAAGPVQAGTIVGGSTLIGTGDLTQLEIWLGEGPLTLTNIFTHTPGDGMTSTDFHAASDGQGRTFVAVQVLSPVSHIVGGYNPQSWDSSGSYHLTPNDVDRTAFVFNLTTATLLPQITGTGQGQYQTYNHLSSGPTFGGGHDLWVNTALAGGYVNPFGYGAPPTNLLGTSSFVSTTYGTLEVFRIDAAPAVPEPSSLVLAALGLSIFGVAARRRK